MVSVGRRYLDGVNKFCCLWKEGDLYFFYTIWFEDALASIFHYILLFVFGIEYRLFNQEPLLHLNNIK